jgi:serine/threonine protein phosphatase PrpC
MIKVNNANFISELGKRNNNEDNCAINPNKTYIVCDGVGGSEKGEVASDLVVREFIYQFNNNDAIDANEAIRYVEDKLSEHITQHPETMGMATTLTLAHLKNDSVYIAWCGDSRVYQFRNGNIVFKTIDHSWVNEAVKAGIITKEEAINHPKSNVITRAIQGSHKPVSIEDVTLTDLQVNDTFLLCSDGILESWSDDDLIALFTSEKNVDEILNKIKGECALHSKDNFTAIVFKLDEVSIKFNKVIEEPKPNFVKSETNKTQDIPQKTFRNENYEVRQTQNYQSNNHHSKKKIPSSILIGLILLVISTLVYFIFLNNSNENENKADKIEKIKKNNESSDENSKEGKTEPKDENVKVENNESNDENSKEGKAEPKDENIKVEKDESKNDRVKEEKDESKNDKVKEEKEESKNEKVKEKKDESKNENAKEKKEVSKNEKVNEKKVKKSTKNNNNEVNKNKPNEN